MTALAPPPVDSDHEARQENLLSITINLLPAEIVAARAGRSARRGAIALLVAAALGTGAWYYSTAQDTDSARSALNDVNAQVAAESAKNHDFDDLNKTKAAIAGLAGQLKTATAGDVAWYRLYPEIRNILPAGVGLTNIAGTADLSPVTQASKGTLPAGSLVINGEAKTKPAISSFLARLGSIPGVTDPLVTSVSATEATKNYTFTIQASVTSKALNTRYSKAAK